MSTVHELVLHHGVERARELARNKQDRRLIEIAAEMLAEETARIGFSHAGFALTSLPHKAILDPVWRRESCRVKLLVESGRDGNAELIGLPYGAKARMILIYLQTQAVRFDSREIELGRFDALLAVGHGHRDRGRHDLQAGHRAGKADLGLPVDFPHPSG